MVKYSEKLADFNRLGDVIAEVCILAALDIVGHGIGATVVFRVKGFSRTDVVLNHQSAEGRIQPEFRIMKYYPCAILSCLAVCKAVMLKNKTSFYLPASCESPLLLVLRSASSML